MSLSRREANAIIRKAVKRVPAGESIRDLNIMPMMDMMTILLVAFIQFMSAGSQFDAEIAQAPVSETVEEQTGESYAIVVTDKQISLDGDLIAPVKNGKIDPKFLEDERADSVVIPRLYKSLEKLRLEKEKLLRAQSTDPKKRIPIISKVMVIAYKEVSYGVLVKVLRSATKAGFKSFRLMVRSGVKSAEAPAK